MSDLNSEAAAEARDAVYQWIKEIVIGFNFCPFAKREFESDTIRYSVISGKKTSVFKTSLSSEFEFLDANPKVETCLLIFAHGLKNFHDYLDFLDTAQQQLSMQDYEGVYQLASFHPEYVFDNTEQDDAANYTNRSPYPVIHILREASLEQAIASHKDTELIPERNINFTKQKGAEFWRRLLSSIRSGD